MDADRFALVMQWFPAIAIVAVAITIGWVVTTWLKIKNGYPLENSWGVPLHPRVDKEAAERIKLLTNENAQLRAEIGSVKDRLETIERIVTDGGAQTAAQIEALRERPRMGQAGTAR